MGINIKEINKIFKKEPSLRECAKKEEENKLCVCGHLEKYHHNHKDYAWGVYSICRRCMMCVWDVNKGCYEFKEKEIKFKEDDVKIA